MMLTLLTTHLFDYLNNKRGHLCDPAATVPGPPRHELTTDKQFDIVDKQQNIKQPVGSGTATYNNPNSRSITLIDFENFINSINDILTKGLKRPDFIAYDDAKLQFIINELSTGNPKSKLSDAKMQLSGAANLIESIPEIKNFIDSFAEKMCIFSCRQSFPPTPQNMAGAFGNSSQILPQIVSIKFQPITKLGYIAIQTDVVDWK